MKTSWRLIGFCFVWCNLNLRKLVPRIHTLPDFNLVFFKRRKSHLGVTSAFVANSTWTSTTAVASDSACASIVTPTTLTWGGQGPHMIRFTYLGNYSKETIYIRVRYSCSNVEACGALEPEPGFAFSGGNGSAAHSLTSGQRIIRRLAKLGMTRSTWMAPALISESDCWGFQTRISSLGEVESSWLASTRNVCTLSGRWGVVVAMLVPSLRSVAPQVLCFS